MNHVWPQLNPGNFQVLTGHKNGVGKNFLECVGMSTKMCISHAHKNKGILPVIIKTSPDTIANTKTLCVKPYKKKTQEGISFRFGGPNFSPFIIL